mmetsp:Transcript_18868/g.41783  ORF Transcript_18868/g.41783 Transcript_18868/m.41783 type:complete len:81 (+) Transcript_18868:321-563(+)
MPCLEDSICLSVMTNSPTDLSSTLEAAFKPKGSSLAAAIGLNGNNLHGSISRLDTISLGSMAAKNLSAKIFFLSKDSLVL